MENRYDYCNYSDPLSLPLPVLPLTLATWTSASWWSHWCLWVSGWSKIRFIKCICTHCNCRWFDGTLSHCKVWIVTKAIWFDNRLGHGKVCITANHLCHFGGTDKDTSDWLTFHDNDLITITWHVKRST
jgi:hypothetical protein